MPIKITVLSEQLQELGAIRDIGEVALKALINKLSNPSLLPTKPKDLQDIIKETIPDYVQNSEIIVTALLSLYTLIKRRNLDAKRLVDGLTSGIIRAKRRWPKEIWDETKLSQWEDLRPLLIELFSLSTIKNVEKTLDLSYDYTNLLQNAKILTEIRPVFDDYVTKIQGAIVSHILRLHYSTVGGNESISIAMDEEDVNRLRDMCDRALKKSIFGKNFMHQAGITNAIISGEEE